MKKLFLFCAIFSSYCDTRNLLILLDQEGITENIGRFHAHYLTGKLLSALESQDAPILINSSLLNNFIEQRKYIEQISLDESNPDKKSIDKYQEINLALNTTYKNFIENGIDPVFAKQLTIEEINKKFYSKEAFADKSAKDLINLDVLHFMCCFETYFSQADWNIYANNKSFYLLIPKKYSKYSNAFKIDSLVKIENIEDPAMLYLNSEYTEDFSEQIADFINADYDCDWIVSLFGHGGTRFVKEIDAYSEVTIADMSINNFKKLLNFLNSNIKTRVFHFATCFGGGRRLNYIFDNQVKYKFPIISSCLSDGVTYALARGFRAPNFKYWQLDLSDVVYENNELRLSLYERKYDWKQYFKSLKNNSFDFCLDWLYSALQHVTPNILAEIATLRLPMSDIDFHIMPDNVTKINKQFLSNKSEDFIVFKNKQAILIETPVINKQIVIDSNIASRIISLIPGPDCKHYIKSLDFKSKFNVFCVFDAAPGDRFEKYWAIDSLSLVNNSKFFAALLGDSSEVINLEKVYIHAQRHTGVIRILFSLNDSSYMVVKTRDGYANSEFAGFHKLNIESTQKYLAIFENLKQSLIVT